jgi:hypothetical protein
MPGAADEAGGGVWTEAAVAGEPVLSEQLAAASTAAAIATGARARVGGGKNTANSLVRRLLGRVGGASRGLVRPRDLAPILSRKRTDAAGI